MGWEASSQAYQVQALPRIAILLQVAFQGHRQRPGALSRDQGDEQLPAFEVSCCAAVYVRYMKDTIGTVGAMVYHYKLQACNIGIPASPAITQRVPLERPSGIFAATVSEVVGLV